MDLSAVIFVVLALAWAVYLIPKALQHHDEVAGERLEEGHTEKVRILTRRRHTDASATTPAHDEVDTVVEVSSEDTVVRRPVVELTPTARAARNRRRVLGVLLGALVLVAVLAGAAVVPWWSLAVPGVLTLAFLVIARLSVRAQQRRRTAPVRTAPVAVPEVAPHVEPAAHAAPQVERPTPAARPASPVARPATVEPVEVPLDIDAELERLLSSGTSPEERVEVEAALADDGSLWDPLPLTLPTYVGKATARRTVRTIELTGVTSSGHDESDTALAREAEEQAEQDRADSEQARRAAGA
ncbi:hypothetical protein SAMN04488570_1837 [Nocardioides scoriae]|uniref:Uncharacterized protein n=1 Tax=Nocardioides scoriae TaxID=642780 RepID=A0A1H1S217_9ACTN|nr:hypothetical protein [Nocardioides scoriae]SDS41836.1 hypothetical protein SAMN04488570_1837 [Nocardioides scoriae]